MAGVDCVKVLARLVLAASLILALACVPEERPGATKSAPSAAIEWTPMRSYRSVPRVVASASATQANRARVSTAPANSAAASELLQLPYTDDFERNDLGVNYLPTTSAWKLDAGRLCATGAKNRPVWLTRRLPTNVRIEFDAVSYSEDGDIKVESFGDGKSFATTTSYTDASGYIFIYGGWKNSLHVLARRDEHGKDRLELALDGATPRSRPVVPERRYRFRIERKDGKTLTWWVDAEKILQLQDPAPLFGPGHDHFAFNAWLARVCFDNLRVVPLGG